MNWSFNHHSPLSLTRYWTARIRRRGGCLVLASLLLVASCEDETSPAPPPPLPKVEKPAPRTVRKEPGFIAFVGAGENDPLWPILKTSAAAYADTAGTVEIRYFSARAQSPQAQLKLLQSLNDPEMRGLCIQIIDPQTVNTLLEQMVARGIPVVSMVQPAAERARSGHVGWDEEAIGIMLADTTVRAVSPGSIMVLHAGHEHPLYAQRLTAFEKRIALSPEVEIFAGIDCHMDGLEARKIMRDRMERYPRLSAWVALDDWPIRDVGLSDDFMPPSCKLITFGGGPAHWPLIRSGRCPAVVTACYNELGPKAVQFCETAIRGPSMFGSRFHAPLRTVWAANLDDFMRDWTYWSTGEYPTKQLAQ